MDWSLHVKDNDGLRCAHCDEDIELGEHVSLMQWQVGFDPYRWTNEPDQLRGADFWCRAVSVCADTAHTAAEKYVKQHLHGEDGDVMVAAVVVREDDVDNAQVYNLDVVARITVHAEARMIGEGDD